MIPVNQSRTGDPKGQCTEASFASLLEVPLDAIPDLYGGQAAGEPRPTATWIQLCGFVLSRGYQFVRFNVPEVALEDLDLDDLGFSEFARELLRGHHLIIGENPDGVGHMCVGLDGELVHDPNPSRRGLVTVDELGVLVPLEDAGDHAHWLMRQYNLVDGEWELYR